MMRHGRLSIEQPTQEGRSHVRRFAVYARLDIAIARALAEHGIGRRQLPRERRAIEGDALAMIEIGPIADDTGNAVCTRERLLIDPQSLDILVSDDDGCAIRADEHMAVTEQHAEHIRLIFGQLLRSGYGRA